MAAGVTRSLIKIIIIFDYLTRICFFFKFDQIRFWFDFGYEPFVCVILKL